MDPTPDVACDVDSAALVAELDLANAAFARQDAAAFQLGTDRVRGDLACVHEELPQPVIADLHRTLGLRAYVDRDGTLAIQSFAAARALEPEWAYPTVVVPLGHPIRDDFVAMDPAASAREPVPAPRAGRVSIDGAHVSDRPIDRPLVFQRTNGAGRVVETALVPPGGELPPYPAAHPLSPVAQALLWTGAVALVGGGVATAAVLW